MERNCAFISYAHADKAYCEKICALMDKYQFDYWQDENGLTPEAEDFNATIEQAIDESLCFICVWTKNISESDYCRKELERAFEWKNREPLKRHIFILKMEASLDYLTGLPKGCNLHNGGRNILNAYNDDLLEKSIVRASEFLVAGEVENGLSFDDFSTSIFEYYSSVKYDNRPQFISKVYDESFKYRNVDHIAARLLNKKNIFLYGERGSGKTAIVKETFFALIKGAIDESDRTTYFVPIFVDLESLWDISAVVPNNVLFKVCKKFKVPYCMDKRVKYILLLDGETRTSYGDLPDAVDVMMDEGSGIYSILISHTDPLFLGDAFSKYSISKLDYGSVVECVVKRLNSKTLICQFFRKLLCKAFDGSSYEDDLSNGYFRVIKNIYQIFKEERKDSDFWEEDSFYSINLATTTQKGRLPKKLINDNDILVWEKLIRGNEVFHAIRFPFYLNWLLFFFKSDSDFVFPYKLHTLQVRICQYLLTKVESNSEMRGMVITRYLEPLAKYIHEIHNSNKPVSLGEFKGVINNNDFNRLLPVLVNNGVVSVVNGDIVFSYDFIYECFLNYAVNSNAERLEDGLRTCKSTDLTDSFISYISRDEPYDDEGRDAIEIAVNIVLDERDKISFTAAEKDKIIDIARNKLKSTDNRRKKASILNGIGRLFGNMCLITDDDNLFDVSNAGLWVPIENGYISRYPITYYQYNLFIEEGYQNPLFWEFGVESIKLRDGSTRKRPLDVDTFECVFDISNHPVVGISWYEAQAFCKWLETKINLGLRAQLPTCEYVKKYFTNEYLSSHLYNSAIENDFKSTSPVGIFSNKDNVPEDIIGNVWEWSSNTKEFYGDLLVKCYGGCWNSVIDLDHLFTTYPAKLSSNNVGFRIVLTK